MLSVPPVQLLQTIWIILLAHVFYNVSVVIRTVGSFWANLNPRLTPIVEYGNEVWASDGYAGNYAQSKAILLGLDSGSWVVRARACWNQFRARQIWRIMRAAGLNVTRVLGAQAGYTGPVTEALKCCNATASQEIDAIGIAPYFGVNLVTDAGLLKPEDIQAAIKALRK